MKRFTIAFWVFLIGIAVSAGQIVLLGGLLPERVASHFGANGIADGYLSREAFIGTQWGLLGVIGTLFFAMPLLMRGVPTDLVNLPNKDYWLAPERRAETLAF